MTEKDFKNHFNANFAGVQNLIDTVLSPMFGTFNSKILTDRVGDMGNGNANIDHIYEYGSYRVGSAEVSVWEVVLSDNCRISQARKNIQTVVRQLIGTYSGAFVIFHYDANSTNADAATWRLSWVKQEATKASATSAKRYTYLCGPSYSCRTIAERFNILQNTSNKTLDSITAAFDVEALSDEFFYDFRALYSKIKSSGERWCSKKYPRPFSKLSDIPEAELGFCDFIERHKADSTYFGSEFSRWDSKILRDYIKKLMGRLVFLQFLQKKGWMCGDSNYIKSLFEKFVIDNNENVTDTTPGSFLDKVLEPLFFGVLNTKVDDRKILFETERWNTDLLIEWKDIPYLNGGLFEQEEYDKPNSAFPNALFNELFTLFSEYNFTIDENDPDDKEVGIDPEMLSKIFESQLEDNKDKGAFYTPKEIVDYMCKESLIAYLQTDINDENTKESIRNFVSDRDATLTNELIASTAKKLKDVKICDPAIGSGAFPMGMMNLLVNTREKLDGEQNRAELKKEIICNNIYGVDIEKGAVDIARLRFWLSLIIDEEEAHALPNLDYKIMQGDSLIHRFNLDVPFNNVLSDYNKANRTNFKLADYKQWVKDYLETSDHQKKEEFRKKIEEIKSAFRTTLYDKEKRKLFKKQYEINEIESRSAMFPLTSDEKDKIKKLKKDLKELEQKQKDILDNKIYQSAFEWRFEFPQILDDDGNFVGFDIVIGNPPYVNFANIKPTKVRELYKHLFTTIKNKCDLYNIFTEQAYLLLKDFGNCSFIFSNSWMGADSFSLFRKFLVEKTNVHKLVDLPLYVFPNAKVKTNIIVFAKEQINAKNIILVESDGKIFKNLGHSLAYSTIKQYVHYPFSFDKPQNSSIILTKNPNKLLGSIADFTLGIKTSDNNRFIKNQPFSSDSYELIKGENVDIRYNCPTSSKWIWYRPDLMKQKKGAGPRKLEYFTVDSKIVVQDVNVDIFATIDNNKYLCDDTLNVIYQCDNDYSLEYLLAILNAKAVRFWRKITYPKGLHVKKYQLEAIPIPTIVLQQKPIISIVDRILHAKKSNPQADTSMEESMIDILVYLLYGLTYEEIMTIEESFCKPAENDGESNTKKRKKKSVSSTFKKLKIEEDKYTHWLSKYQKDGNLPSEDEMKMVFN